MEICHRGATIMIGPFRFLLLTQAPDHVMWLHTLNKTQACREVGRPLFDLLQTMCFVFLCPLKCMWAAIGIGSGPIYSWDSNSKPYVFQKEMQSGSEAYLVNSGCAC